MYILYTSQQTAYTYILYSCDMYTAIHGSDYKVLLTLARQPALFKRAMTPSSIGILKNVCSAVHYYPTLDTPPVSKEHALAKYPEYFL